MSWPKRFALLVAIVIPVAITATLLYRARARQIAADEALIAEASRRLEQLDPVKKQVEEYQRQKADYEARIQAIERLRSVPSPKALMQVAAAAESSGLAIEEMAVSGMTLTAIFRAPSLDAAERFGHELERRALLAKADVQRGQPGTYSLRGVLLPSPDGPPTPRP